MLSPFQRLLLCLSIAPLLLLSGCGGEDESTAEATPAPPAITIAATIPPIAMIIAPIVEGRAEVFTLMPPTASPHTFEPTPRNTTRLADADAVFYAAEELDVWALGAESIPAVALLDLVPAETILANQCMDPTHNHGGNAAPHGRDPHFWLDPVAVKAIVPALTEQLCQIDPPGAQTYRANAQAFVSELDSLHEELAERLRILSGRRVFVMHPAYNYLLERYELKLGGVVQATPGREATPREIASIVDMLSSEPTPAVFEEPQLGRSAAVALANETGARLYTLDPIGGTDELNDYASLLRYNVKQLHAGLTTPKY